MNGFFSQGFTPTATSVLQAGEYDVFIRMIKEVDDHMKDLSGTSKENYRFANVHSQIAVVVADKGGKGTSIRRFNTQGWVRGDQVPANLRRHYEVDPQTGYAVHKTKKTRLEDPIRTQQCQSIFNSFLNSLTCEDGTMLMKKIEGKTFDNPQELFDIIMSNKCVSHVKIENRKYDNDLRPEITSWRKVSAQVEVTAGADQDEGDLG